MRWHYDTPERLLAAQQQFLEQRIEALTAAGRLDDTQIDRAVAKGLLRQAKAAEVKGKKPPQGGPKK